MHIFNPELTYRETARSDNRIFTRSWLRTATLLTLGIVSLVAASAKLQLLTLEQFGTTSHITKLVELALIEVEYSFALCCLCFLPGKRIHFLRCAVVSVYIGVASWHLCRGESTCGCFGLWTVSPLEILAFDLLMFCLLVVAGIRQDATDWQKRLSWTVFLAFVSFASFGLIALFYSGHTLDYVLDVTTHRVPRSNLVEVRGDDQIGLRFPYFDYIQIDARLDRGNWIILLFDPDCGTCKSEVPRYEHLAEQLAAEGDKTQIALVSLPPFRQSARALLSEHSKCHLGCLLAGKTYYVDIPMCFILQDGVTHAVVDGASERR